MHLYCNYSTIMVENTKSTVPTVHITSIGAGCSNQLQLAQGHNQSLTRPCPCATYIWLLHPAPTTYIYSAQDGLYPVQLALVVFFLPSIKMQRPHLHCGPHPQLALVMFFLCQLAHLLMCTWVSIATYTVWWW